MVTDEIVCPACHNPFACGCCHRCKDCDEKNRDRELKICEAEIAALRDPWVKIEDVPEEWRDGRKCQGFPDIFGEVTLCRFFNGDDWRDTEGDFFKPTHLAPMLEPPKEAE